MTAGRCPAPEPEARDTAHLARLAYGAAERAKVRDRVVATVATIRAEIEDSALCGKPATYPKNGGRLSKAEIFRRARVDKVTVLCRPYHADLRDEVEAFLFEMKALLAGTAHARLRTKAGTHGQARGMRAELAAKAQECALLKRQVQSQTERIRELEAACLQLTRAGRGHARTERYAPA